MSNYPRMDEKVKAKWIAALNSGNFKQGLCHLRDLDNKCCCLGVLADISGAKWRLVENQGIYAAGKHGDCWSLHASFTGRIKLNNDAHTDLTRMNDDGTPFAKIAEWIARNL